MLIQSTSILYWINVTLILWMWANNYSGKMAEYILHFHTNILYHGQVDNTTVNGKYTHNLHEEMNSIRVAGKKIWLNRSVCARACVWACRWVSVCVGVRVGECVRARVREREKYKQVIPRTGCLCLAFSIYAASEHEDRTRQLLRTSQYFHIQQTVYCNIKNGVL